MGDEVDETENETATHLHGHVLDSKEDELDTWERDYSQDDYLFDDWFGDQPDEFYDTVSQHYKTYDELKHLTNVVVGRDWNNWSLNAHRNNIHNALQHVEELQLDERVDHVRVEAGERRGGPRCCWSGAARGR